MQIIPNGQYSGADVLAILEEISQQHMDQRAAIEGQRNRAMNELAEVQADQGRLTRLTENLKAEMARLQGELAAAHEAAKPPPGDGAKPN